jgi:hypothetical protein
MNISSLPCVSKTRWRGSRDRNLLGQWNSCYQWEGGALHGPIGSTQLSSGGAEGEFMNRLLDIQKYSYKCKQNI